ncbi:MAG: hypothetical protein NZ518_06340, partial [Dehalococcoidia bacterium]|nr:hypothetical protein [Dehalococcoidia bacterium]
MAVAIVALLAFGVILWTAVIAQQSIVLVGIDAEDYAQMGRQIASGAGFTSLFMPLNGLAWLQQQGKSLEPPWPNISRFPLPPLVMAGLFRIFGPNDYAAAGYSLIGYLAAAPFAFLIGRRVGGMTLGLLAGALCLAHPDALQLSFSGLTEPVTTAILLATAWLVLRQGPRAHWVAGALFGLSY